MAVEHDILISQYQQYKDEVQEYEKQLYLYETRISEYGDTVVNALSELRSMGIELESVKNLPNGDLDLTDANTVRSIIDEAYTLYKKLIEDGQKLMTIES